MNPKSFTPRATLVPRLPRRTVLRGTGVALALPFLEIMRPRKAAAATGPRRLVTIFSANGPVHETFFPAADGPIKTLPGSTAPLLPLADKLLLLRGIRMSSAFKGVGIGHVQGMASNLTATENKEWPSGELYANGISVDQLLASKVGRATRLPSLEIGVYGSKVGADVRTYISYKGPNDPVPADSDPKRVFDRLFMGLPTSGAPAPMPSRRNRVVLDAVLDDVGSLQKTLGTQDRRVLDQHLTAIRETEGRLTDAARPATASAGCQAPSIGTFPTSGSDAGYTPTKTKLFFDIIARALACDLTRIITFQWTGSGGKSLNFLGMGDHHPLAHENDVPALTKLESWYAQQIAQLATQLNEMREGDASVLDNSVLYWTHELATGQHARDNCHYALLGSGGGTFKTGRAMTFTGRAHNDLLLSLIHAAGAIDVTTFGNPAYVKGPLPLG